MRKYLLTTLAVLLLAAPLFAADCGVYYDSQLCGVQTTVSSEFWAYPVEMRHTFWSMPSFPLPPKFGYVGYITAEEDGSGIHVSMNGMNNIFGDVFSPPPQAFSSDRWIPWDEDAGCYWLTNGSDDMGYIMFDAFVFAEDGSAKWIRGCLGYNAGMFPNWEEAGACSWVEYDLGPVPAWKPKARDAHRAIRSK
jgi:hypothetical protein